MDAAEFAAKWEGQLLSILLAGYTTKETDPAQLFRRMANDVQRVREVLMTIHHECQGGVNGRVSKEVNRNDCDRRAAAQGVQAKKPL